MIVHGEKLFEFVDRNHWIRDAHWIWNAHKVAPTRTICVDQLGRLCNCGEHFDQAHKEGAYPIEVFHLRPKRAAAIPQGVAREPIGQGER